MSIAELAAKINIGSLDPSKNPNNATNRATTSQNAANRESVAIVSKPLSSAPTTAGALDHTNFAFKPIIKKKATASARKLEFIDSDEDVSAQKS